MDHETIVNSRPDREILKKITTPGDYNIVPYEDSRCKIVLSDIKCTTEAGECSIDSESHIFSTFFDGNVLIGDSDSFIDKDFELILQQMCSGETCTAKLIYRDNEGRLMKQISCKIELKEVMEEQLISDWSWQRLHESSIHHKEKGVKLMKQNRVTDAFRRFSKALKMLIAIEPIDRNNIDEENLKQMVDLKVKLYNNLALCQLNYKAYEAALELCNRALKYDPENAKTLYRRSTSYAGLLMYEEAWSDIQHAFKIDPNDKAVQDKVNGLKPKIENINKEYSTVIKKMFG